MVVSDVGNLWLYLPLQMSDEEALARFCKVFGREAEKPPRRIEDYIMVGPVTPEEEKRWRKGEYRSA